MFSWYNLNNIHRNCNFDGWYLYIYGWYLYIYIYKYVWQYNSNLYTTDDNGYTALHLAVKSGDYEIVNIINDVVDLLSYEKQKTVKTDTNFELKVTSNFPYPVSLVSMTWEGNYSPRFYRRA